MPQNKIFNNQKLRHLKVAIYESYFNLQLNQVRNCLIDQHSVDGYHNMVQSILYTGKYF